MNKNVKRALICGGIFLIQFAILAGVSIAHDNGAFETWYRSVFRHPRLIALVCGAMMAVLLMLLCRPKEPMDVGYALLPPFFGILLINGIARRMQGVSSEEVYYGTELGFWADRLVFIFCHMIVFAILLLAIMMYFKKIEERDAKKGEVVCARNKEERRKMILAGMICTAFMWALSLADVMDSFMNSFYAIFDPNDDWGVFTNLVVCGLIIDLIPFIVIKFFNIIQSKKQLVIFAISSFLTNILLYQVLDRISWWDGVDKGFGVGILCGVIANALIILYLLILIDPMTRRTNVVA